MPTTAWSKKRERQYEHIKQGEVARGKSTRVAERIAAATVNKDRARAGESSVASHPARDARTREQLYREATALGIKGRSGMSKAELLSAVSGHK